MTIYTYVALVLKGTTTHIPCKSPRLFECIFNILKYYQLHILLYWYQEEGTSRFCCKKNHTPKREMTIFTICPESPLTTKNDDNDPPLYLVPQSLFRYIVSSCPSTPFNPLLTFLCPPNSEISRFRIFNIYIYLYIWIYVKRERGIYIYIYYNIFK